ncbi:MAG: protoporphyrinogen oxidase [Planctomycetota bacterium]
MTACDLIVVGGGPAGLAHAFWRKRRQPELRVRVLEAADELGGWVRTTTRDGFQLEEGPQGFRPDDAVDAFLEAAGLRDEVVTCADSAQRRFVARGGRLHELPTTPGAVLRSKLLPWWSKLRLLWEPRVRSKSPSGESVAGLVGRRFGRAAVPVAEAMMHGIYAGDAHALEVGATLPVATELEREHGSLLRGMGARARARREAGTPSRPAVCSFPQGMQRSVDALAAGLAGCVTTGARVHALARTSDGYEVRWEGAQLAAPEVCVAIPPRPAAQLLQSLDRTLSDYLAEIPAVSVASCYVGFERAAVPPAVEGFGFLAPQDELGSVLGAIYVSSVFPHQAPEGHALFRVMSGGHAYPHEVDRSDESLLQQATDTLRDLLGVYHPPTFTHVCRARAAIPQYVRGHAARVAAIAQRAASHPGLALIGNAYRKISVVGQWAEAGSRP